MEKLIAKYKRILVELQAEHEQNYENGYFEGLDELEGKIEVLTLVISDLKEGQ